MLIVAYIISEGTVDMDPPQIWPLGGCQPLTNNYSKRSQESHLPDAFGTKLVGHNVPKLELKARWDWHP